MNNIVSLPLILALFFISCKGCCENDKVEYYKEIISNFLETRSNYTLPTTNKEFQTGIESSNQAIDYGTHDFIVIGTGSAGSVVATRLSEIKSFKVLVLEAGGEQNDITQIPYYSLYLQNTPFNWGYFTTPQTNSCLSMNNHQCATPRGKVLGGTSTINHLMYVRGLPHDYDQWEAMGNPGWGSKDVLPYFKKSENSQIDAAPGWHGEDGLWNVEYTNPETEANSYFKAANEELGTRLRDDYNTNDELGVSRVQFNEKYGQRHSLATAFLENARYRVNVNVTTHALVTKIVIDANKRATGVEFVIGDQKYKASASKEVIVSCGAFNSPQLLMLSGIGPKAELAKHNIPLVADLPVGNNLQEHPFFLGISMTSNLTGSAVNLDASIREYLQQYGLLTVPFNINSVAFLATGAENKKNKLSTIEFLFQSSSTNDNTATESTNLQSKYLEQIIPPDSDTVRLIFSLYLLHPKSRGTVTLKSSSPLDFPNIDYNMYSVEDDTKALLPGIHYLLKLLDTKAFRSINATLNITPFCKDKKQFSDEYWECVMRWYSSPGYHPCGSVEMGPAKVLDHELKVHGIEGLRVIDASIFPTILAGHTSAPAVMAAEKGADMIKRAHGFRPMCV